MPRAKKDSRIGQEFYYVESLTGEEGRSTSRPEIYYLLVEALGYDKTEWIHNSEREV